MKENYLIPKAGSDHYFHTLCPSVGPHFSKSRKTKHISRVNSDHCGWDCGSSTMGH